MTVCQRCKADNPDDANFCKKCGRKLEVICPKCNRINAADSNFCNGCGASLLVPDIPSAPQSPAIVTKKQTEPETIEPVHENVCVEGERKYATVLFSDLSGYTAMSEKLDPEEVKEIMGRIFGEVAQVVAKYEGHIDKFIGDAVMAIFGVPTCHEDDAVRAILAAQEIHSIVETIGPSLEARIGKRLTMHTGINTGLIVTGEMDIEKGVLGVVGDTINVASRLEGLAGPGEIFVGHDTCVQAGDRFSFEAQQPTKVKGKSTPIKVYKVVNTKTQHTKVQRLQGMRAKLIGRKMEFSRLKELISLPEKGKGVIVSICGDAGTGKSRLLDELKASIDHSKYQWFEGYAYSYAQNISYFPLISLLNKIFKIREEDSPAVVKKKIKDELETLLPGDSGAFPILEVLYSVRDKDAVEINPQFWMLKLREIIQKIFIAVSHKAPTIVCLEDLHWADPSSIELITSILTEIRTPVAILCIFRPAIALFNDEQRKKISKALHEIELKELSSSESHEMVESLLNTDVIPSDLRRFIEQKTEGNPFYLEEMINSLIESGVLVNENGAWHITREISGTDISSTIHGVISARIDRLKKDSKQILQEASVIGRSFYRQILKRITEIEDGLSDCLENLQSLDLVKEKAHDPDIEYIFKHALTQEVVYNGLLKTERQVIHERIGLVIEQLFKDRLPEFYETLAYHFSQAGNNLKAVEYLVKSGEKSLDRYSLDEAHQQFKEAFELILSIFPSANNEREVLLNLLNQWALVYYYQGDFKGLEELLATQEKRVQTSKVLGKLGLFYCWQGVACHSRGNPFKAQDYFIKSLSLGKESQNSYVIGFAYAWLSWSYADMGLFPDGIKFGKLGVESALENKSEHYVFFKSLSGLGANYFILGNSQKCLETGKDIIKYGQKHQLIRCLVFGYIIEGCGFLLAGDNENSVVSYRQALKISLDPFYTIIASAYYVFALVQIDEMDEAEKIILDSLKSCETLGLEQFRSIFNSLLGVVCVDKGEIRKGIQILQDSVALYELGKREPFVAISEQILGKIYFEIIKGDKAVSFGVMVKNLGFILKNVPFATTKADYHFNRAIAIAEKVGAIGIKAQSHLDLGIIYKIKKKTQKAKEHLEKAIPIFKETGAYVYLEQAEEALASLK